MFDKKAYNAAYRNSHREHAKARNAAWRDSHQKHLRAYESGRIRRSAPGFSDYQADKVLKCRYGITLEQKKQMYDEQKGLCKLCGEPLPPDFRKASVDHNHDTDNVRGLLHQTCNWLVGIVETKEDLILTIHSYLERAKGEKI